MFQFFWKLIGNVYFKKLIANEIGALFGEVYRLVDYDEDNSGGFTFIGGKGSLIINYMICLDKERRRQTLNRFQYALNQLEFDREWYKKYEKMLDTINGGNNLINWNCMKEVNEIKDILIRDLHYEYSEGDSDSDSYSDSDSDSD